MTPDPLVAPVVGGVKKRDDNACINCGEAQDGGYCSGLEGDMNEGAVGPFCSQCWEFLHDTFVPRPEPREPEPEYSPEAIAELRREFEAWIAKRDVPPEVLAMVMPWKDAAVRPASAPSSRYPIRAHVEGCPKALRVPVDLCDCGGREFTPGPSASAPSRPLEDEIRQVIKRLKDELGHLSPDIQATWTYENPYTSAHATLRDCLSVIQRLRVLVPGGDPQEP